LERPGTKKFVGQGVVGVLGQSFPFIYLLGVALKNNLEEFRRKDFYWQRFISGNFGNYFSRNSPKI